MASDEWKNGAEDAMKFLQDPKAMETMAKKVGPIVGCFHSFYFRGVYSVAF